jgi:hypothetical protein
MNKNIIIICTHVIKTIAINLIIKLKKIGYDNTSYKYNLTSEECYDVNNNDLYIILYYNEYWDFIPNRYIIYQIEQSTHRHINRIVNRMQNALCIWDFSVKNYMFYKNNIKFSNFFYNPFPFCIDDTKINKEPEYDILFYGAENKRRNIILQKLEKKYKVLKCFGIFNEELHDAISKSKIIVNLHYYDDCSLETCRINEVLQYNKLVVSEKASENDNFNMEMYGNVVIYFDEINKNFDNMEQMFNVFDKYLNDETGDENYNKMIEKIKVNVLSIETKSLFYLQKNMIRIERVLCELKNNREEDNRLPLLHNTPLDRFTFSKTGVNGTVMSNSIKINKNNIKRVLFGSDDKYFDITEKFINFSNKHNVLFLNTNMNLWNGDPCDGIKKTLTIINNDVSIIKIKESHNELEKNIIFD